MLRERERARAKASTRIGAPMLANASALSLRIDSYQMTIGVISAPISHSFCFAL
jgi:hypothetical protein